MDWLHRDGSGKKDQLDSRNERSREQTFLAIFFFLLLPDAPLQQERSYDGKGRGR